MPTITLQYTESSIDYEQDYDVKVLQGYDEPDELELVYQQHKHLDGSITEDIIGLRRVITIDFGVVETFAERKFIGDFFRNTTRQIRGTDGGFADVSFDDPSRLVNQWEHECRLGRRYIVRLRSSNIEHSFGIVAQEDELAYIKKKVAVTGTQSSPETFTTNTGKLATQENSAVYPTFNSSTHDFVVLINSGPYQERKVNLANVPTISAGNITFQLALSDAGANNADTFAYCDITILLQVKP